MIQSKKELANLTVDSGESWITEMNTDQLKDYEAVLAAFDFQLSGGLDGLQFLRNTL